jgi:small subunit ribosomal protein S6
LAANVYEGMFILDSNRFARDPDGISGQIPALIEKLGGEMLVSRLWEDRRLAFPIKGQRKGTYWLTYFRLNTQQLVTARRECDINENILRYLFVRVDPRIVDALVEHAKTAPIGSPAPAEEAAAPVAAVAAVAAVIGEDLELPDALGDVE